MRLSAVREPRPGWLRAWMTHQHRAVILNMTPERYRQVGSIYHAALEMEPGARAAWLAEACAGDDALREEVELLLASNEGAGDFISGSALEVVAGELANDEESRLTGKRFGHYRVLSLLGTGGMAEVYLAEDIILPRKVALKLLPAAFTQDTDRARRFEHEAHTVSALNHPNIVTIYEIGSFNGRQYIASELVEGSTLRDSLAAGMSLAQILHVAIQVAGALAAAHRGGVVHRDIKPENIMLRPDGYVKVLDFGLAKQAFDERKATAPGRPGPARFSTSSGIVVGTTGYMSPEQARGEKTDHRSDIFSLGVVIYEMASGDVPFKRRSQAETMNAVINEPHTPLVKFNEEIPAALGAAVDRALSKDPADRYQSMGEMLRDLRQVGRGAGILGPSDSQGAAIAYLPPGRRSVKRWMWAMTLLGLALLIGLGLWFFSPRWLSQSLGRSSSQSAGEIKSLAVLPLENLSGDPSQEYFADGMTDALIGELAKIGALRVISRTSAMYYKGIKKTLPQIAGELKVDAVVEGTVMRSADEIQVRVQLVQAASDRHLWSETYGYDLRDVLTVQSEAARDIAREIQIKITPDEQARLTSTRAVNRKAYNDYLLGKYHWNRRTEEHLLKAIDYFKSAIQGDETYAPAYAFLADCYITLSGNSFRDPRECNPRAKGYATKALELDGNVAEAHTVLAVVKSGYEFNREDGEREHKRAIELNAGNSTAHLRYALFLAEEGRFENSLAESRRALELDPASLIVNTGYAQRLDDARRFDEAIDQLRKTLALDPNFYLARLELGYAYAQTGRYAESLAELNKAAELSRENTLAALGYLYAISGRTSEARRVLAELQKLSERRYVSSVDVAAIYTGLSEKDEAFIWLEKSFQEHEITLSLLGVQARFDSLRKDIRFGDLLRRLGFAS
jgi:serine/threonine-protein kinase